jgi:hypothetical protein
MGSTPGLLHVASLLVFLFADGASGFAMLRLRRETDPSRLALLLDVSKDARVWLNAGMAGIFLTGGALAWRGGWLRAGWMWASVVVFVGLGVAMGFLGTRPFERARQALGIPNGFDKKARAEPRRRSDEEIRTAVERAPARLLAAVGWAGLFAILWLMMAKQF